jgi:glycosyltransferase involved in cell wall biosynthesis
VGRRTRNHPEGRYDWSRCGCRRGRGGHEFGPAAFARRRQPCARRAAVGSVKLVYVTPFLRVPPDFGLAIRDYNFLKLLSKRHELVVASFETAQQGPISDWVSTCIGQFFSLGPIETGPRTSRFALLRRAVSYPPSAFGRASTSQMAQQFERLLATYPDTQCIILSTHLVAQTLLRMNLRAVSVPVVGVFADVASEFTRRQFELCGWRPFKFVFWVEWLKTIAYERQISRRFKYLVTMSEHDARIIRRFNPSAQVFVSPNGVDTQQIVPALRSEDGKASLLMVANFGYAPNVDAFNFLYKEIMPMLWRHEPHIQVFVIGRFPTPEMMEVGRVEPRIQIVGAVGDVSSWYAAAELVVVPLRLGSGVKLKVLEAFAYGLPVVTTAIGAEGIEAESGTHFIQADTSEDFALGIAKVLENRELRITLGRQARRLVEEKYDWKLIVQQFDYFMRQVIENNARCSGTSR